MKVKDCELKETISCNKNESILAIAKLLKEKEHRHIIVTEDEKPIGIISTTDINNRVVAEDKDPKKTQAEEIMISEILVKDVDDELLPTYIDMIKKNIFSCPVTENGKLKGMLLLKEAMSNLAKLNLK